MKKEDFNEEESGKITINSFPSLTMGDMRRQSFVQSSAERAMYGFGITHLSVFLGDWALKKFGEDSFFKKRFIWIDTSDNTFHWSKVQDRSSPHKRIKFLDVVSVRNGPPAYSSFLDGHHQFELCWSIEFKGGKCIDIKMTDANKVNDWIRVIQTILNNYSNNNSNNNNNSNSLSGSNQMIQPVDVITS